MMKQKLLSILVLLSLCVTGAWAFGQTETITFTKSGDYNDFYYDSEDPYVGYFWKTGTYLKITQKQVYSGGDLIDKDGLTAHHGVTIEGVGSEWITGLVITCDHNADYLNLNEENITIDKGSFTLSRDDSKTYIIISGVNSSKLQFTCTNSAPHFNKFEINYLEAEPVLVNKTADLEAMVNKYANQNVIPYHTRKYKKDVATTLCLPFNIAQYTSGQLYRLVNIAFDEEINEWVATMEANNKVSVATTAHTPYLFLPSQDGEVSFYGETTNVLGSVEDYYSAVGTANTEMNQEDTKWWVMRGTYKRFDWSEGDIYGFSSAFHGDQEIDFTEKTIEPGDFVKAAQGAYWPEFRAFLKYEPALLSRGDVLAQAPQRVIVRLINANGSVTKLEAVKMEENGKVWYDLQGRSYNSKPTKAGIYVNNGKKMIVK